MHAHTHLMFEHVYFFCIAKYKKVNMFKDIFTFYVVSKHVQKDAYFLCRLSKHVHEHVLLKVNMFKKSTKPKLYHTQL